jgi:thiol-disulfide isomerase/thioredoxin
MRPFIALALAASAAISMAQKKPAPEDLNLTDLTGAKVHLHDYRGKIVVLNFWATWCAPCRQEMPMLVEAEKTWGPKGIAFVGVSLDDSGTKKKIPAFVQQFQIGFPVWVGATPDQLTRLKMGNAVPDTAFVDEQGVIFARIRGQMQRVELDERLSWITGDRGKPAPEGLITHLEQ